MNEQLIQELKQRMPDFDDPKKLSNLEVRTEKHHEREGRYTKMVFNNFSQALAEIETKLKSKHKLAKELCRASTGTFTIVFELPAVESKKKLESALQAAKAEYESWVSNQQENWLNEQLESALKEQEQINKDKQEKEHAALKASLLKALQTN